MSQPCALCARPILDTAYACVRCTQIVSGRLTDQAPNYAEMAIQVARLARYGEPTRLSKGDQPLPYNPDASRDASTVDNTLSTWARHIASERGLTPPAIGNNLMLWLAGQCDWLRYRPEGAEALDELEYAARLVERCIDAPAQHWFAGLCMVDDCEAELYARHGAATIRCRTCGIEHDAGERKTWLLRQADNVLGTATEIARFCSAMRSEQVTAAMVRGLAFRGRIIPHGADRLKRPTYRVGDVLATLG